MEKANQITAKAFELFMKFGIRSVSMDDLSNELGISKKTLYKHFSTKTDLVMAVVQYDLNVDRERCSKFFEPEKNAIDEMVELGKHYLTILQGINPSAIYDLAKYYPQAWNLMETEHRGGYYRELFAKNLRKGIQQGLFRADVDVAAVTRFYLHRASSLTNNKLYPSTEFQMLDLFMESLSYHIHGIGTPKGIKRFEKVLKEIKNQSHAA